MARTVDDGDKVQRAEPEHFSAATEYMVSGGTDGEVLIHLQGDIVVVRWDRCRFCGRTEDVHHTDEPFLPTITIEETDHLEVIGE